MSRIHRPRSTPERLGRRAKRTEPDACSSRQRLHRPSGRVMPPVLEEQRSFGVVASTWPPRDRPPAVLSLHSVRTAAETDRDVLAAPSPMPYPRGAVRTDYDVIEFPHAVIASQLNAPQEHGYGHAMASASERPREDGALPTATPALHNLADRHPRLFADTIRYLFGLDRDIARAVTESVRLGYALDQPLDAALNALATDSNATETAP